MPDRPLLDHDTTAQLPSSVRQRPVCLEIPVTIQGLSDAESAGGSIETFQPFLEESKTVLVFSRGAVVRHSAGSQPGQRVVLTNRHANKQVPCRVIQSRHFPGATGYVELEFLEPSPGFWGVSFPDETPGAAPTPPSASRPAPPKPAAPLNATPTASSSSPIVPAKAASPSAEEISPLADSVRFEPPALSAPAPRLSSPFRISPPPPPPMELAPAAPSAAPPARVAPPSASLSLSLSRHSSPVVSSPASHAFGSRVLAQREISAPAPEKSSRRMPMVVGAVACTVLALTGAWYYFRSSAETLPLPSSVATSPAPAPAQSESASPPLNSSTGTPVPVNSTSVAPPGSTTSAPSSIPEFRFSTVPEKSPAPASNKPLVPSPAVPSAPPVLSSASSAAANAPAPPPQPQRKPLPSGPLSAPINAPRPADLNAAPPPDLAASTPDISISSPSALPGSLAPNSAAPPPPVRTGGVVKPPHLLSSVAPVYPLLAKQNRVTGDVVVDAVVDATGKVTGAKVLSGPSLLHQAALDAVRQFKYEPARLNDQPTPAPITITLRFR